MAARDLLVASFVARNRKRKPPRNPYFDAPSVVPGYGDYKASKDLKKVADATAAYDKTTTPRYGAQRAPYRKGERFKRKNPYKYGRGDAARAHRPRLD